MRTKNIAPKGREDKHMKIKIGSLKAKHINFSEPVQVKSINFEAETFTWMLYSSEQTDTFDYVEHWEAEDV
ncbi:hypothetical protein A7312_16280 [Paenibacillus polymyxa]|uniref:Uncharacterized protein n=2 Tax=Paenibacillus polymyxa TaxID=1406 RepID=A0ABX2Z7N6_PAEPO|nr:hypothetical protein A7312_16280 [Paenibacillus polymyxa]